MYILENNNKLSSAVKRSFSDLKLTERKHLQEWIAAEPSALGEDLLIIQKEFDGFSETKERLDLLALDKQGRLVVIENKLDDSGKDVTWQAIKYASYCSSLSKQEILDIYSKYIAGREKAIANILDFYDIEDIDEVELNVGDNTQRIFFVAANFRKEVTSSVLWLSKFGLEIKCFKVTPFTYNNSILILTKSFQLKMLRNIQSRWQQKNKKQHRSQPPLPVVLQQGVNSGLHLLS